MYTPRQGTYTQTEEVGQQVVCGYVWFRQSCLYKKYKALKMASLVFIAESRGVCVFRVRTLMRKSPVLRPAIHATPPSSTDSRYCSAGNAGVGLNSSIGVSAMDHTGYQTSALCHINMGW